MTREKWYRRRSYWRKTLRTWRERNKINTVHAFDGSSMKALKELYEFYLEPVDQVKLDLIRKYESKVSERLKLEGKRLLAKGNSKEAKDKFSALIKALVDNDNFFLKLIPKTDGFGGSYYPVPIIYGESE